MKLWIELRKPSKRPSIAMKRSIKTYFQSFDKRRECQLHHPLHVAGHFLNPEFFYSNPAIEFDEEIIN